MKSGVYPIIDFHKYGRWNHERLVRVLDQNPARLVIRVFAIERGIHRAGVEYQRQDLGTGRSSPARRAVSVKPDAPMPRLRGRGRCSTTFSSKASRTTESTSTPRSAATLASLSSNSGGISIVARFIASL